MGSIRRSKTKRRTRDLDQIHRDLRDPKSLAQFKALIPDEDKPSLGVHYCVECSKYFEQAHNLREHRRGKNHKRRVRMLEEEPYSQKEADAAAGTGCASFYEARELRAEQLRRDEEAREMEIEA